MDASPESVFRDRPRGHRGADEERNLCRSALTRAVMHVTDVTSQEERGCLSRHLCGIRAFAAKCRSEAGCGETFPSGLIGNPFVLLVLKRMCNLQFLNGTGTSTTLAQEGVTPVLPRVRLAPAKQSQLERAPDVAMNTLPIGQKHTCEKHNKG